MGSTQRKLSKKVLTVLMAACLITGLWPVAAFGAGSTSVDVSVHNNGQSEPGVSELVDQNGNGVHVFGSFSEESQLYATDLKSSGGSIYTALLSAAAGSTIDKAYQLDIVNGTLLDVPEPSHSQNSVLLPASSELLAAAQAGNALKILAISEGTLQLRTYERTAEPGTDGVITYANTLNPDDVLTVRPVEGGAEVIFLTKFASESIGAFALAYDPATPSPARYTVRVVTAGTGSGTWIPAESENVYFAGATPTFTFFPNTGSVLAGMAVTRANGAAYDASKYEMNASSIQFKGIDSDLIVTATFNAVTPEPNVSHQIQIKQTGEAGGQAQLQYTQAANGQTALVGPRQGDFSVQDAADGRAAYLTLSPAEGCIVEGVWVYGEGRAADSSTLLAMNTTALTIPAITEDITIEVRYGLGYAPPVLTHTLWGVIEGDAAAGTFAGMQPDENNPGRYSVTVQEGAFQTVNVSADTSHGWGIAKVTLVEDTPASDEEGRTIFEAADDTVASFEYVVAAVSQDMTVHVFFEREMVSLTFPLDVPGGSVTLYDKDGNTIDPIVENGKNSYPIGLGDVVTIDLTPDDGYVLSGVIIDGELVVPDEDGNMGPLTRNPDGTYSFVADGKTTFTPVFVPETVPPEPAAWALVDVATDGNGSVVPAGAVTIEQGSSLTLNLSTDGEFIPEKVLVTPAGSPTQAVSLEGVWTWTFNSSDYAQANHYYLYVTFAESSQAGPDQPEQPKPEEKSTIYISTTKGGRVSPAGNADENGVQTYIANPGHHTFVLVPDPGYELSRVYATLYDSEGTPRMADVTHDSTYLQGSTLTIEVEQGRAYRIFAQFKHTENQGEENKPVGGKYTVSVQAQGPGTVSPSGSFAVNAGAAQTFSLRPNAAEAGFENVVSRVELYEANTAGIPVGDAQVITGAVENGTLQLAVESHIALRVTFATRTVSGGGEDPIPPAPTTYILGQTGRGGSVSPQGMQTVTAGAPFTLTFTEQTGYTLTGLSVLARVASDENLTLVREVDASELQGASPSYAYLVPADLTKRYEGGQIIVRAVFNTQPQTHVVTVVSEGPGTISPDGNVIVAAGESQSFFFYPEANTANGRTAYVEGVWIGGTWDGASHTGGRQVAGEVASYELAGINADTLLYVKFAERTGQPTDPDLVVYALEASASEGGVLSPEGTTQVRAGGSLLYTAVPDAGWRVKDLTVSVQDGADWSAPTSVVNDMVGLTYRFQAVSTNARIHAEFERTGAAIDPTDPNTYIMQIQSSGPGLTSPVGSVTMTQGVHTDIVLIPNSDDVRIARITATVRTNDVERDIALSADDIAAVQNAGWVLSTSAIATAAGSQDCQITLVDVAFEQGKPDTPAPSPESDRYVDIAAQATPGGAIVPASMRALAGEADHANQYLFAIVADKGYHAVEGLSLVATRSGEVVDADANGISLKDNGNGTYLITLGAAAAGCSISLSTSFEADVVQPVPEWHTIKVTVEGEGEVSPAGEAREGENSTYLRVAHGASQTFTFIPRTEDGITWPLEYIQIGTANVPGHPLTKVGASYTLFNIGSDMELYAKFATYDPDAEDGNKGGVPSETKPDPVIHTVASSVSADGGGSIEPSGQTRIADGGTLTFLLVPDEEFHTDFVAVFEGLEGQGDPTYVPATQLTDGVFTLPSITADKTVIAHFAKDGEEATRFTSYQAQAGAHGSIAPATATVREDGPAATFEVRPHVGYEVKSITLTDMATGAARTLEMDKAGGTLQLGYDGQTTYLLAADFAAKNPTPGEDPKPGDLVAINVHVSTEGGTISPSGSMLIPKGSSQTFTITPEPGYAPDEVLVNGHPVAIEQHPDGYWYFTIDDIQGSLSIDASFKADGSGSVVEKPVAIKAQAQGPGRISPAGALSVAKGQGITFTMIPDSGCDLASLELDGRDVTAQVTDALTYRLEKAEQSHTVVARFTNGSGEEPAVKPYVDINVDVSASGTNVFGDAIGGAVSPTYARVVRGGSQRFILKPADGSYVASATYTMAGLTRSCELHEIPLPEKTGRATDHQAPYQYVVIDGLTSDVLLHVVFAGCENDPANPGGSENPDRYVYDDAKGTVVDTTPDASGGVEVKYPDNTPDAIPGIDDGKEVIISPTEGEEIEKITLGDTVVEILDTDGDGKIDKVVISDADGSNRTEIDIVPPGSADAVQDALDEFNKKVSEELGYKPGDEGYDTKWVVANTDENGELDGTYTVTVPVTDSEGNPVKPSLKVEGTGGGGIYYQHVVGMSVVNAQGGHVRLERNGEDMGHVSDGDEIPMNHRGTLTVYATPLEGWEAAIASNDESVIQPAETAATAAAADVVRAWQVTGPGALTVTFTKAKTTDPSDVYGPDDVAAGIAYAITPSVEGHGRISPNTVQYRGAGKPAEFNLIPDTGYAVVAVEIDGKRQVWSASKFVFEGGEGGSEHTIKVVFGPTSMAGANTPAGTAKRMLGSMSRLASTGDTAAALSIGVAGAACAAFGVALLVSNRRRKKNT